jgi:malate dehydrogenase (oxaloacetate-decarboxylating)(NADP+)
LLSAADNRQEKENSQANTDRRATDVLNDPQINKANGFTEAERQALGLVGLIEAAHAVTDQVTAEQLKLGMLFPPQSNILEVEIQTAARVATLAFDAGLARVDRPADMVAFIRQHVYKPEYQALV